jgi:radical SAM-linked protein
VTARGQSGPRATHSLRPPPVRGGERHMVPDPPQQAANPVPPGPPTATAVREKVRVRFRKGGDLRLVSHRDLMKCFERMFRRAGLPVAATKGFNPRPRMVFALSLALGIVGRQEVVELELDAPLAPEVVHDALARQAPPGLEILSVRHLDTRLSGQPRRVCYCVPLSPRYLSGLPERVQSLLAAPGCWVERTRPQARRFDLRPFLRDLRLSADSLEIDLWVTPGGTARPDEVLDLLGLAGLRAEGVVLERALLELHDESPNPGPGPPYLPSPPPNPPPPVGGGQGGGRKAGRGAGPGPGREPAEVAPRPTPLVPGPLSFED